MVGVYSDSVTEFGTKLNHTHHDSLLLSNFSLLLLLTWKREESFKTQNATLGYSKHKSGEASRGTRSAARDTRLLWETHTPSTGA